MQVLAEASGRVIEREEIYQRVWGYAMAHGDRSVDVFVRKLRSKLQKLSPGWEYIHTHFGVGYRFEPEPIGPAPTARSTAAPGSRRGRRPWSAETARRAPRRRAARLAAVHTLFTPATTAA